MSILTLENMKAYIEYLNDLDNKVLGLEVEDIKGEASKYE